jgi:hypothetical protein
MGVARDIPDTGPRATRRLRTALVAAGLVALILAIYGQTLTFDFVLYDDPDYVVRNTVVGQGLTPHGLAWALTTVHASNWHPLTWVSHMLDCEVYGLRPAGHHLTSVILHALNSLILFGLLRRLTGEFWPSAFVAALFAVHPTHVESVAWVAERKDVLSTLFFLLATLCYVGYVRRGGAARYAAVAALFALGLMAKPMVVTLPLVLLLLDYWPLRRRRSWIALVLEKLPLFALAGASAVATLIAQRAGGSMESNDLVSLPLRVVNATVSYARYVIKTVWPADLSVLYPHPNLAGGTPWSPWQLAAAGSFLVVVTVIVFAVGDRYRYARVGWSFYLITLLPVIGLVQVGQQAMADRYTYLPSIGLFLVVAWGARDVLVAMPGRPTGKKWAAALVAGTVLIGCTTASWAQTRYWRDSLALFERALAVTAPTPIMLSNLGVALAADGRLDEAIACHLQALEIKPDYAKAHNNLGTAYQQAGRIDLAIRHYRAATGIDPGSAAAHYNLGVALQASGRSDEAAAEFRRALEIDPALERARGRLQEALAEGS